MIYTYIYIHTYTYMYVHTHYIYMCNYMIPHVKIIENTKTSSPTSQCIATKRVPTYLIRRSHCLCTCWVKRASSSDLKAAPAVESIARVPGKLSPHLAGTAQNSAQRVASRLKSPGCQLGMPTRCWWILTIFIYMPFFIYFHGICKRRKSFTATETLNKLHWRNPLRHVGCQLDPWPATASRTRPVGFRLDSLMWIPRLWTWLLCPSCPEQLKYLIDTSCPVTDQCHVFSSLLDWWPWKLDYPWAVKANEVSKASVTLNLTSAMLDGWPHPFEGGSIRSPLSFHAPYSSDMTAKERGIYTAFSLASWTYGGCHQKRSKYHQATLRYM